jgi:hypothetical protein
VLMVCVADRANPTFRRFGAHKDAIRFEVIDGKPVQPIHVVLTQASVDAAAKEIEKYEVRSCDVPDSRKSESAPAK